MKKFIRKTLIYYISIFSLIGCNNAKVTHYNNEENHSSIETAAAAGDTVFSEREYIAKDEKPEYRGNLIVEHDNIKVYAYFGLWEADTKYGDDITAKDETYLIRYIDDIKSDSMILKGPYNCLLRKKSLCQITVGTDTVNMDITMPFNKFLDLRFIGVLPSCRFYRFSKHYALNERSSTTDFQINLAIQENAPDYIRNFINEMIRDNVARYFGNDSGDKTIYPHIPLYDIMGGDFTQMCHYYYHQFCRLYKQESNLYLESAEIPLGSHYSYQYYAYPVWENSDSTLITWKFYYYCYMGGVHGGEQEFFLTFDNKTGRILGVKDFYSKSEFKKAMDVLTRQLNEYHDREAYDEYSYSADLDIDSTVTVEQTNVLNEVVGNKIYPRPALTRQGIVFSYQTYEKGANSDGVLHFTQPYK